MCYIAVCVLFNGKHFSDLVSVKSAMQINLTEMRHQQTNQLIGQIYFYVALFQANSIVGQNTIQDSLHFDCQMYISKVNQEKGQRD